MCSQVERERKGFLLTLATPFLLCLYLKDSLCAAAPLTCCMFLASCCFTNTTAQCLVLKGACICSFGAKKKKKNYSTFFLALVFCLEHKSVYFSSSFGHVVAVPLDCLHLTLFSVLASCRLDSLLLNGRPAIRRAQLDDRFSRAGG